MTFENLASSAETVLKNPALDFINNELNYVTTLKKKMIKAREELDSVITKSQKKQKTVERQEKQEIFDELKVEYIFKLLSIKLSKKYQIVFIVNEWMKSFLIHYDGGNKLMSRFENFLNYVTDIYKEKELPFLEENGQPFFFIFLFFIFYFLFFFYFLTFQKVSKKTLSVMLDKSTKPTRSTIQGYLYNCSKNRSGDKNWWMVSGGKIYKSKYYHDFSYQYSSDLLLYSIKKAGQIDSKFCFEVTSPSDHFILGCVSERDREDWMAVIQNAIGDQLNNSHSSNNSPTKDGKKSMYALETVLSFAGNEMCADCEGFHFFFLIFFFHFFFFHFSTLS